MTRIDLFKLLAIAIFFVAGSFGADLPASEGESSELNAITGQLRNAITVIPVEGGEIYTATVKLPSGETAFMGLEPIKTAERSLLWEQYCKNTKAVCSYGGLFRHLAFEPDFNKLVEGGFFENHGSDLSKSFKELLKAIPEDRSQEEGSEEVFNQKLLDIFERCIDGARGMHCEIGDYIAYISKEPIQGFCHLPLDEFIRDPKQSAEYITKYDHIVMSVSVFGDYSCQNGQDLYYEHRGIFRNPMSFLRKDYKNIALLLHSFAGAVSLSHRNFQYMVVNPDSNKKCVS